MKKHHVVPELQTRDLGWKHLFVLARWGFKLHCKKWLFTEPMDKLWNSLLQTKMVETDMFMSKKIVK